MRVWVDEDEWTSYKDRGDPVLHIEVKACRRRCACTRLAALTQLLVPCAASEMGRLHGGRAAVCEHAGQNGQWAI